MIGIVDYGMGNLLSVKNAFDYLGADVKICEKPSELEDVDKIILPGVGAFPDSMKNITGQGFYDALNRLVLGNKKPILGVCLGMQIMAKIGHEMGKTNGLGWFDAEVIPIETNNPNLKIPNIGWENVELRKDSILLRNIHKSPDFYFVHSFCMKCNNEEDIDSVYYFDNKPITATVHRDNIFGTQFHPEKSSDFGKEVLINFIDY